MTAVPLFALFVLTENIDADYIKWLNKCLERARAGNFDACWSFWVPDTDSYHSVPRERADKMIPEGTQPPLPEDFTSYWSGKTIQECGEWLHNIPSDISSALNPFLFAVVTEHSRGDDQFTSCQIIDLRVIPGEQTEIAVHYFPQNVDEVAMQFATNLGIKFYEKADCYQAVQRHFGRPDRSHVRPDQYSIGQRGRAGHSAA